jgi:CheY-like chemotaxis protein/DNA-binding XRE family transcriptional regulator
VAGDTVTIPDKPSRHALIMKAFGKAVRFFRTKQALSQEALADRAGLDRSYMSQIERGIKNATLGSVWRICQAMGIRPSALMRVMEQAEAGLPLSESPTATTTLADGTVATTRRGAVLIVDDDEDICAAIGAVLGDSGFDVRTANSGLDAMRILAAEPIIAVVSDIRMANGNGLELLDAVRRHFTRMPVMFMTGYDDVSAEDARRRGAVALFNKPFDLGNFVQRIRQSIAEANLN